MRHRINIVLTCLGLATLVTLGGSPAFADQARIEKGSTSASNAGGAIFNIELAMLEGLGDGGMAALPGANLGFRVHRNLDLRIGVHMVGPFPIGDAGASFFFKRGGAVSPYFTARMSHVGLGVVGAGVELGSGSTVLTLEGDVLTVPDEATIIVASLGVGFRM